MDAHKRREKKWIKIFVEIVARSFEDPEDLAKFIELFSKNWETLFELVYNIAKRITDVNKLSRFLFAFPNLADILIIGTKYYDRFFDSIKGGRNSFGYTYRQEFYPMEEKESSRKDTDPKPTRVFASSIIQQVKLKSIGVTEG